MVVPAPVAPRPAAAVVLVRDRAEGGILVCMVRRHSRNAFMPGVYVFPGGTLTARDAELERTPDLRLPLSPTASLPLGDGFYAAAIRECFEEAGVLLAVHGTGSGGFEAPLKERLARHRDDLNHGRTDLAKVFTAEELLAATDRMIHWSHWITPESFPRRFDTHFFLAQMPADQEPAYDPRETTEAVWVRPEEALERFRVGTFSLVYATERQLEQLVGLSDTVTALSRFSDRPVRANRPRVTTVHGEETIVLDDE